MPAIVVRECTHRLLNDDVGANASNVRTSKAAGQVRLVLAEGLLRRAGRVRTLADLRIHLGIDLRVALLGRY